MLNNQNYKKLIPLGSLAIKSGLHDRYLRELAKNNALKTIQLESVLYTSERLLYEALKKIEASEHGSLPEPARAYFYKIPHAFASHKISDIEPKESGSTEGEVDFEESEIRRWLKQAENGFETLLSEAEARAAGEWRDDSKVASAWLRKKLGRAVVRWENLTRGRFKLEYEPDAVFILMDVAVASIVIFFLSLNFVLWQPEATEKFIVFTEKTVYAPVLTLAPEPVIAPIPKPLVAGKVSPAPREWRSEFIKNYSWYYQINNAGSEATYDIRQEDLVGGE